jgi:hypothetical protein
VTSGNIIKAKLHELCPSINENFCSRSRHAKKITTGI